MSSCIFNKIEKFRLNCPIYLIWKNYSRRSNNSDGSYKIVSAKKPIRNYNNDVDMSPNYEFLALTKGSPFFLPGNIGPAWHDLYSTVQPKYDLIDSLGTTDNSIVECIVQQCPRVMRQTVCELFPNKNLEQTELSVITLIMKRNIRLNKELETEKMAQAFVLAAHDICKRFHNAGYWADFINPFSGRPYLFPPAGNSMLYTTDEKFRCLDFQINSIKNCKIITNEENRQSSKRFVGSLFTNAPSKRAYLDPVFEQDD